MRFEIPWNSWIHCMNIYFLAELILNMYIYTRIIIFLCEDLYIKCTYIHILYMYNVQASLTVVTEMKFEAILRVRLYASTVLGWCVNDVKCTLPDLLG